MCLIVYVLQAYSVQHKERNTMQSVLDDMPVCTRKPVGVYTPSVNPRQSFERTNLRLAQMRRREARKQILQATLKVCSVAVALFGGAIVFSFFG